MTDNTRLLQIRTKLKQKRPKFIRQESWRYKRLKTSWRRPKGIDNKVRKKKKGTIKSPNVGYRSPKKVRYLHPSGFKEVVVHNLAELEEVKGRREVVKIAHNIGRHKRIILQDRADELNILILNRTRILLPGEELLMEEGRGFEKEIAAFPEEEVSEEVAPEEEVSEDFDSDNLPISEENDTLDE
ncbi:MAG: 50S ribosomal protein L32e [Candidatus Helarchaeota archaeon]